MASRRARARANARPWEQEPVYSREWFAKKASEAKDRIDREWSDSMKANSVYAAATLPSRQPLGELLERFKDSGPDFEVCGVDDDQATGDASDGCGDGDDGDEDETSDLS